MSLPQPLGLFPLQTVLFPGGVLPLRVFEARYLDLVSHCLRNQEPFGVIGLRTGPEAGRQDTGVELETVGVLARIDEVDSEQPGILRIRCLGLQRFRLEEPAVQQANGLWVAPRASLVPDDPPRPPGPATRAAVQMLEQAITVLREQGLMPFAEPLRLDDAGWVANRWCELLPMPQESKQRLMALEDPAIRLSLVDAWLRDKKIVVG